jgi:hypothetical protein
VAVGDDVAVAVLEVVAVTRGRADHEVEIVDRTRCDEHRAEPLHLVGADHAVQQGGETLARLEDVVGIERPHRHHAPDRAGAVDVRDRPAHHVDAGQQFRLHVDEAVGLVAGALEVLPRTIDNHGDAAEVLQAADVDRHARLVGALLRVHPRHAEEHIFEARRHVLGELFAAHGAHAGQRLDHDLLGAACHHRDRIEIGGLRQSRRAGET